MQLLLSFQNLIVNVIKFTSVGVKPNVLITADHQLENEILSQGLSGSDHWPNIKVIDNGIGFDQNYSNKVFELFQKIHTRTEYEGTGIGLSICKKLVQIHGGNITTTSTHGLGSTFAITLPGQHVAESKTLY